MRRYLRNPHDKLASGDRVNYIVTAEYNGKGLKGSVSPYCEDPSYAYENSIGISVDYYLNKQLRNPITRFFEPLLSHSPQKEFFHATSLEGIDTSHLKNKKVTSIGILGNVFSTFKILESCLSCNSSMKPTNGFVENRASSCDCTKTEEIDESCRCHPDDTNKEVETHMFTYTRSICDKCSTDTEYYILHNESRYPEMSQKIRNEYDRAKRNLNRKLRKLEKEKDEKGFDADVTDVSRYGKYSRHCLSCGKRKVYMRKEGVPIETEANISYKQMLCNDCKAIFLYFDTFNRVSKKRETLLSKKAYFWSRCQSCRKTTETNEDIVCTNTACKTLWQRKKNNTDITRNEAEIVRFTKDYEVNCESMAW